MPFKSQAQWSKFGELLKEGKISQAIFDEWAHSSKPFHELPKRHSEAAAPARPTAKGIQHGSIRHGDGPKGSHWSGR